MEEEKDIKKLGPKEWVLEGTEALAESGVEAVRVEPIARRLKVTKGSFYWHFKNRQALLEAILQHWVSLQTDSVIERVEHKAGEAKERLLHLFELTIEDDGRVERSIRAWAVSDAVAASVLETVDQRRLSYTKDLFIKMGFVPFEAMVRSRLVYYALIAEFSLVNSHSSRAERLKEMHLQHSILTRRD